MSPSMHGGYVPIGEIKRVREGEEKMVWERKEGGTEKGRVVDKEGDINGERGS